MQDAAAQLRASGQVGEQADGYLGMVGRPPADVRAQVDAVNIKRRAFYTDLAVQAWRQDRGGRRNHRLRDLRHQGRPGQYYRLPDGVWRQRDGSEPIPRPSHCG